jgi:predicted O-linked N-acetylglucosamine transferase (SPINDLY family)
LARRGTTYLIADAYLIPPKQREYYDEKIAYLPRCYQPTDTTRVVAEPQPRAALGLPANAFVYCLQRQLENHAAEFCGVDAHPGQRARQCPVAARTSVLTAL